MRAVSFSLVSQRAFAMMKLHVPQPPAAYAVSVIDAAVHHYQEGAATMNSRTLKGLPVVSLTEGMKLGVVESTLFDPATLVLRAFRVKGEGQSFLIPLDQVGTVGADAVMVENSQVTRATTAEGAFGGLVELDALARLKVVDAAGTLLGMLRDVDSDPFTGVPLSLTIHKGGFLGLGGETLTIEGAAISGIGHDLITVANFVTASDTDTDTAPPVSASAPPTTVPAPDADTAPPTTSADAPPTTSVTAPDADTAPPASASAPPTTVPAPDADTTPAV
jgi:uncharacterized protein YrrD